jgi:DNA-binding SARP family transcriptional activator
MERALLHRRICHRPPAHSFAATPHSVSAIQAFADDAWRRRCVAVGTLEITLFGPLQLMRDGESLPIGAGQRVRDLLSYLLLHRQTTHARDQIAGLFWSDRDDQRARHCLNTALWRLQRLLQPHDSSSAPYLLATTHSIGFNAASDAHIDVAEFETRCALADQLGADSADQQAAIYRQAIEIYRADLLPDCYEDWCLAERQRLQHLYLRALGRLMAYHRERNEYLAAIDIGLRLLECDPLREEIHRDLISLYLAAGHPADALRQYRACAAILQRELGIEPMPETRALLPQILDSSALMTTHTVDAARLIRSSSAASNPHDLEDALRQLGIASAALEAARVELVHATQLVIRALEQPPRS